MGESMDLDELTLGQIKEIKKLIGIDSTSSKNKHRHMGKKVIVRTYSAGVHYGTLVEKNGSEVVLENAIRIWYWNGAASLSQLAVDGTNKPDDCKFSVSVSDITVEMIEILPAEEKAQRSIEGITPWKK